MGKTKGIGNWEIVNNGVVHLPERYFIPIERMGDADWLQILAQDKKWLTEDDLKDLKKLVKPKKPVETKETDEGQDSEKTETGNKESDGKVSESDSKETKVDKANGGKSKESGKSNS